MFFKQSFIEFALNCKQDFYGHTRRRAIICGGGALIRGGGVRLARFTIRHLSLVLIVAFWTSSAVFISIEGIITRLTLC